MTTSALILLLAGIGSSVSGEVSYVHAEQIYIDLGRADGVIEKTRISIFAGGKKVATGTVALAAEHSAIARWTARGRKPRPGDRVVASNVRRPKPEKLVSRAPTSRSPSPPWASQSFAKVDSSRAIQTRALTTARSSAHLRSQSWVYVEGRDEGLFQRASLNLWVDGPLDERERFWLDADVRVSGQLSTPVGARERDGEGVWLDVYRAALSWRATDTINLGLGRSPQNGMRWGLVDGAFIAYQPSELLRVELAAGARPSPDTLDPTRRRSIAAMNLDGGTSLGGTRLSWYAGGSWLGDEAQSTEAIESTAGLRLDAAGRFWFDVDAGALYLPDSSDSLVIDRANLSGAARFGDAMVRISGRRLDGAAPPSDAGALSTVYGFGSQAIWEASSSVDAALLGWGDLNVSGGASAGATFGEDEGGAERHERIWAHPTLLARLSRWGWPWLRLGYRAEAGWMTAHLGEVAVGARPTDRLSFSLWQQVGVRMIDDSGLLLPTGSSWLRVNYRIWAPLHIGVRARAIYLDTGLGIEFDARLTALDWL